MKKTFIFGTKLRMYLCELPLIFVLAVAIYFNPSMENPGKLYPLIIAMSLGIVFMFVYLFRGVSVSGEKIQSVGLFSSKDSVLITPDTTLQFTIRPKNMLKIELFGDSDAPIFDWMDKSKANKFVNLYRDIAVGGFGQVRRVLLSFGVSGKDIDCLRTRDSIEIEYPEFVLKKDKSELGDKYSVYFTDNI